MRNRTSPTFDFMLRAFQQHLLNDPHISCPSFDPFISNICSISARLIHFIASVQNYLHGLDPAYRSLSHLNFTIPSVALVHLSCDPLPLPIISLLWDAIVFGRNDYYGFCLLHPRCHFHGFDWDLSVSLCLFATYHLDVLVFVSPLRG